MLRRGVPASLAALWRGPVKPVRIDGETTAQLSPWSLRPVEVVLGPGLVLTKRLTIPRAARHDLQSAIAIFMGHQTPFEAHELLIHAQEDPSAVARDTISYTLRAVPRAIIETQLASRGVRASRVERVSVAGVDNIDLASALRPGVAWRRRSFILPAVIALVALILGGAGELASRAVSIARLQEELTTKMVELRAATAELEERSKSAAGLSEAIQLLNEAPSAFISLLAARELMPPDAIVTRLQVNHDGTRLSVNAPDILATIKAIGGGTWIASVDGPITANPAGGESGMILLRGPS